MIKQAEYPNLKTKFLVQCCFLINVKLLLPTFFYNNNLSTVSFLKLFFTYKLKTKNNFYFFFISYLFLNSNNLFIADSKKSYVCFLWKKNKKLIKYRIANQYVLNFKLQVMGIHYACALKVLRTHLRYNLKVNLSLFFCMLAYNSQKVCFFVHKTYFLLLFTYFFCQYLRLFNVTRKKVYLSYTINTLPNVFTQKSLLYYNQKFL